MLVPEETMKLTRIGKFADIFLLFLAGSRYNQIMMHRQILHPFKV